MMHGDSVIGQRMTIKNSRGKCYWSGKGPWRSQSPASVCGAAYLKGRPNCSLPGHLCTDMAPAFHVSYHSCPCHACLSLKTNIGFIS